MTDIANLVLGIDSTQVPKGTAALNDLTAAGARAEAATAGMGTGFKGAGAEAAAMASAAQLSARAAMDQAAGFRVASDAARVNTLALRESLVVTREIMRGNFTRLPGSAMILAQGIGAQGGIGSFVSAISQQLGLVKQLQNAELAEAAAVTASAAAGVRAAAAKAGANVLAADTEVALAEAQLRVAEGATAEAAAQARLAAAHEAVAAAAEQATIAENALAAAQGRATEASAASAAATRTMIGGAGVGLLGIVTVAGVAYGAIREFQDQVKDSGALDKYAESLNLTDAQVKKLGGSITYLKDGTREISDLTVSFGDIMAGVWQEVTANSESAFGNMKTAAGSAFDGILSFWNQTSAALSAGLWTLGNIAVDVFQYVGQLIGQSFYNGVNMAVDAINSLNARIPKMLGGGDANLIPHLKADPSVATFGGLLATARRQADANAAAALAQNRQAFAGVERGAVQSARDRLKDLSDSNRPKRGKKPKKPKKAPDDKFVDQSARLDEEILSAKEKLAGGAVELANLQLQRIAVETDKKIADAQQLLKKKELTQGEEQHLELQIRELADLKRQAVLREEQTKLLTQQQAAMDQQFGFQTDALKFANDNASTAAEHRKIELEMLDIQYQQKKADLDILLAKQKIAGDLAAQAITQANINNLPVAKSREQENIIRSTMDPMQKWLDAIPHEAGTIMEALQQIEVKGFDGISSAIAGVITGTESLGQAFKNISQQIIGDIVQMTVKMLIFRAISGLFGGGSISAPNTSANVPFLSLNTAPLPHLAGGGSMIIGGSGGVDQNLLSLNGKPVAMVGQGETLAVYPNRAANDRQSGPIEIKIGFGDAPEFAPYVQEIAGSFALQALSRAVDHTNATVKALNRTRLNSGK